MMRKPKIIIVGDAMLDTYIHGTVSRVSPEAPIPVVCPTGKEYRPGGAANVAGNAASLGAIVTALFFLGMDCQAEKIKGMMGDLGIDVSQIFQAVGQDTVSKVRLMGNGQQIARIDVHDCYLLTTMAEEELLTRFREALPYQDVVVLSDYGKGVCTESLCQEIIHACHKASKPVIVDPKGTSWEKYRGAFIITPNLKELNLFSGMSVPNDDEAIERAYRWMHRELGVRHLVLTRSEYGMSLLNENAVQHFPTQAKKVKDVSGAGDTVVAALSVRLAGNITDIEGAVRFANVAAGVVVGKPGTAMVSMKEVLTWNIEPFHTEKTWIYAMRDIDFLDETLDHWREAGEKIITTNGCFDVLHLGHVKVLNKAKELGGKLIVAINADAAVKRLKGAQRPINNERDRAAVLLSLRMVDAVVIFDPKEEPDELAENEKAMLSAKALVAAPEAPMALMRHIHPDVHVKGGDYNPEDVPEAIFAGRLLLVPFEDGYSTTRTIEHMERTE